MNSPLEYRRMWNSRPLLSLLLFLSRYDLSPKLQIFSDLDALNLEKKDGFFANTGSAQLTTTNGAKISLAKQGSFKSCPILRSFFFCFGHNSYANCCSCEMDRVVLKLIQMPPLTFLGRSWLGRLQMAITSSRDVATIIKYMPTAKRPNFELVTRGMLFSLLLTSSSH